MSWRCGWRCWRADAAARRAEEGGDGAAADGHHRRGFLAGGTEVKIVTGLDDHSRFCVI